MSALLSAAPTVAFTTLLTQCTPYLRPVPTVLPTTFTNPSLPHPLEVPNFHLNFHTGIARCLSSSPHPPQVPSRAFWQYNDYSISGTHTLTPSPRAPVRLLGARVYIRFLRNWLHGAFAALFMSSGRQGLEGFKGLDIIL